MRSSDVREASRSVVTISGGEGMVRCVGVGGSTSVDRQFRSPREEDGGECGEGREVCEWIVENSSFLYIVSSGEGFATISTSLLTKEMLARLHRLECRDRVERVKRLRVRFGNAFNQFVNPVALVAIQWK